MHKVLRMMQKIKTFFKTVLFRAYMDIRATILVHLHIYGTMQKLRT